MNNFDLKKYLAEGKLLSEGLADSDKSTLIQKFGMTNPKLLAGSQKAEFAKTFKRSKDNKFPFKGQQYSKDDILGWTEEEWAADMFDKDDIEYINYYFDKWPKQGQQIKLEGDGVHHIVTMWDSEAKKLESQYPGGSLKDYDGIFVYEFEKDGKTMAIAHSLDDTYWLMTKINNSEFKIDKVLYS
jgi:hypothetical protein